MAKQTFTSGQVLTAAEMNSLQENDYNWTVTTKTASYTLAAGDEGTRVVMNNAGATTITVDDAVFAAGDVVWLHNIGAGTCTVTAGTATVNTAGSLALAQWEGGSLYFTSASSAIFFRGGGGVGNANFTDTETGNYSSGGNDYKYITFNSSSTITIDRAGFVDVLCIGGGGGGGSRHAGGGGGGGYLEQTSLILPVGTLTVTVGAGGAGGTAGGSGSDGGTSGIILSGTSFIDTLGGGFGGGSVAVGHFGSSGGGAGATTNNNAAAVNLFISQGNNGGTGGPADTGGGGGGAGSVGSNGVSGSGGDGGTGTSSSIDNVATARAGGGGGGATSGNAIGIGNDGGGDGSNSSTAATAGTANKGGGGGGGGLSGGTNGDGGNGGSGIIIVRVKV
jgi:hypothetical protein